MMTTEQIANNSNTRETTPSHIWTHQLLELAGVSHDDMERHCTRERVGRWFNAGEPVWMAAESLRLMVANGKREERAQREVNYLHDKVKVR